MKAPQNNNNTGHIDFFPIYMVMFLDALFSLIGQPRSYWLTYSNPNEANPVAFWLLSMAPAFFLIGVLIYASILFIFFLKFRGSVKLIFIMFVFLAHFFASSAWILHIYKNITNKPEGDYIYFYLVLSYVLMITLVVYFSWKKHLIKFLDLNKESSALT